MPLTLCRRFFVPMLFDKIKVFIKILRRVVEWKHPRSFAIKALATRSAVFLLLKV